MKEKYYAVIEDINDARQSAVIAAGGIPFPIDSHDDNNDNIKNPLLVWNIESFIKSCHGSIKHCENNIRIYFEQNPDISKKTKIITEDELNVYIAEAKLKKWQS